MKLVIRSRRRVKEEAVTIITLEPTANRLGDNSSASEIPRRDGPEGPILVSETPNVEEVSFGLDRTLVNKELVTL